MQGQDFQSSIKSRAANSVRGLAKRAINGDQSQTGGGKKAIKRKTSDTSVSSPAAKRKKTTRQKSYICLEEKKKKEVQMSLIHEASQELAHSSLDLFTVPPTLASRVNSKYTPYYPVSTISPN